MGLRRGCAAAAVGAMVATAAVGVLPNRFAEGTSAAAGARGVALTATEIPIIDFDQTFGPLSLVRKLVASLDGTFPNSLTAALVALSETGWAGPFGSAGSLTWDASLPLATQATADSIGLTVQPALSGDFDILPFGPAGVAAGGGGQILSQASPTLYLGGGQGWGGALISILALFGSNGSLALPGVGSADGGYSAYLGYNPGSELVLVPGGGLRAILTFTPAVITSGAHATLGPVEVTSSSTAYSSANVRLCTGSAVASCGGVIAETNGEAPIVASSEISAPGLGTVPVEVNLPNSLNVVLKSDSLAVTGSIGGTLTVGAATVGRIVPIDIQIPLGNPFPLAATRTTAAAAAAPAATDTDTPQTRKNTSRAPRAAANRGTDRQGGTGRSARTQQSSAH